MKGYNAVCAYNGQEGLNLEAGGDFDLILVDLNMPVMDGFEVVRQMKRRNEEIPVIVISGQGDISSAMEAIRVGAVDFLAKPINNYSVLTHAMAKAFERRRLLQENRLYQEHLEQQVEKRTRELFILNKEIIDTQKEVVLTLGEVVETRSHETAKHTKRVAEFSYLLAQILGIDEDNAQLLRLSSPMHDVGKIGIPDNILHKPGRLDPEEFEIMKTHTTIGYDILKHSKRPIIKTAAEVSLHHHENWDGSGYPAGLKGEEISVFGRITKLVDVFDALLHKRSYKQSWELDRVLHFIEENKGRCFDPDMANSLLNNTDKFVEINNCYPDHL